MADPEHHFVGEGQAPEPLKDGAKLYRVKRKVRPLPGHPRYWDIQFGILNVWLFSNSPTDAALWAAKILEALPYKLEGSRSIMNEVPVRGDAERKRLYEQGCDQYLLREDLARESGLAFLLIGVGLGADEAELELTKTF